MPAVKYLEWLPDLSPQTPEQLPNSIQLVRDNPESTHATNTVSTQMQIETDLFDMHGQRSRLQKNTALTNLLLAEQQRHQPPTDHCTWSIVSRRRRSIRRRRLVKKHCSAATTTTTSHMNHRRAEGLKRMRTQIFIIN